MTKHTYLVGYPVKGAASPVVMQATCDYLNLDVKCEYWELEDATKLPEVVKRVRSEEVMGAVITMPYKESVIALIDRIDEQSQEIGAINTIYKDGEELVGCNSDVVGVIQSLTQDAGFEPAGKRVIILGAGGAARACGFALAKAGAQTITIANRTMSKAEKLVSKLKPLCSDISAMAYDDQHFNEVVRNSNLVINSTPCGMIHTPLEGKSLLEKGMISEGQLAFDAIYKPLETPFLRMAREAGAKTLNGMGWMIYSTVMSLRLFIRQEPNVDVMFDAARKLAKESGW